MSASQMRAVCLLLSMDRWRPWIISWACAVSGSLSLSLLVDGDDTDTAADNDDDDGGTEDTGEEEEEEEEEVA